MPLRSTPTARQERLGRELRRMREAAALTARDTAKLLGVDPAKVSHIEAGRLGVSEARLRRIAAYYECGDVFLIEALAAMTHEQRGQGWWEAYRGILPASVRDVSEIEHHATWLNALQITHAPGVLQTEEYARTIFGYVVPPLPNDQLEALVQHRMERRGILFRERPPTYRAVIHEAALRMRFCGRKVMRSQLEHLQDIGELPHVEVRVIPFEAETYIGSGHAMLHMGGPVPQLDTVQIDSAQSVSFLDADAQLKKFRAIFSLVDAGALDRQKSRDLIRSIAHGL
ncbi:helix-turn-helix domain-containing protein [Streptomyces sp. N2-109]|uniref:Helix-turn-helix domain-containing protein n=1 Tax=Streptomyces gossypii TaxID=2883101 RepID=A0ABT2JXL4_9ACTN|nr:helix-turn-helix transcriptional regulator [Streptomyces gossypii]MCT2592637.1 helix-turn-helix domain-containing protein [Streptomyces gossypii]